MLWNATFVDFVYRNKLPLDHYSFHEYGSGGITLRQIGRASSSLNRYRYFDTTAEMLHDFTLLLGRPALLSLSWAWWVDTPSQGAGCMGLLTTDGRRKAVYNAWKAYAMMPVDRRTEGN